MIPLTFAFLVLLRINVLSSGLVNSRTSKCWKSYAPRSSLTAPFRLYSTVVDTTAQGQSTSARAAEANKFQVELDEADLSSCYGMLHASGCRRLSDLSMLTTDQVITMGADASHSSNIHGVTADQNQIVYDQDNNAKLSTMIDGTPFSANESFNFEVICAENDIFKGRLFTPDQCNQLKRMSEYHAYQVNSGWIGMSCKSIPGFIELTDHVFQKLFRELYSLFPGNFREGSIRYESTNEPHLVRYIGSSTGAPLHTDTAHKSITMNVLLSDNEDFGNGGTYLKVIDQTIKLEQGEVLIHPGNLEHAGADITFGVRHLLVAFIECEWEDNSLNKKPPL
ncbi:hypothetical protein ACHAXR_006743 [Thalassiosira sp. AJA248-18]